MEEKLTPQEVADELGYHVEHVRRLLRNGVIHGDRFSSVWVIDRTEVERIKAAQSKGGRFYPNREKGDTTEQD